MIAPCKVAGCPGRVAVEIVDGALVEAECPFCARRGLYVREVLGTHPDCTICGGPIPAHPNGRTYRKYCDACVPVAARVRWQKCNAKRARDASRTPAPTTDTITEAA